MIRIRKFQGKILNILLIIIALYNITYRLLPFQLAYPAGPDGDAFDNGMPSAKNRCPRYAVPEKAFLRKRPTLQSPKYGSGNEKPIDWLDFPTMYPVLEYAQLPKWNPDSTPELPKIQAELPQFDAVEQDLRKHRRKQVKQVFQHNWNSYRTFAWEPSPHDELRPISGGWADPFAGLGATLVDSLDTLWIMGMKSEFLEAVRALEKIDLAPNATAARDASVNVFESIIRYVGGFLSAYEISGCNHGILLQKAVEFGDMLYLAFDTPSRMPVNYFSPRAALSRRDTLAQQGGEQQIKRWAEQGGEGRQTSLAEIATMTLEFTKLSMLTGDMKFYDQAGRVSTLLELSQNRTVLPGLWPKHIDSAGLPNVTAQTVALHSRNGSDGISNQDFVQALDKAFVREADEYSMGAESDSAYEYIPKMYLLLGGPKSSGAERYLHMYSKFVDAAVEQGMWFRPMAPGNPDVLLTGTLIAQKGSSKPVLNANVEHLGCFVGGMLGLGSRLVQAHITTALSGGSNITPSAEERSKQHLELAQGLTDGCAWSYAQTITGIAPEAFTVQPCSLGSGMRGECLWDSSAPLTDTTKTPLAFRSITDPWYHLRPEAIESIFYLWRITGQEYLQDVAWDMFVAIDSATATDHGNAEIENVQTRGGGSRVDRMESFWMAETLKYFYLMFCDGDVVSLDEWVLNTEAHPLRIPR